MEATAVRGLAVSACVFVASCASWTSERPPTAAGVSATEREHAILDPLASRWLDLLIGLEPHDEYEGLNAWAPGADRERVARQMSTLADLERSAIQLRADLAGLAQNLAAPETQARAHFLIGEIDSYLMEVRSLGGAEFSVEEEARVAYGLQVESVSEDELRTRRAELEALIPGEGPIGRRYAAYIQRVTVSADRVPAAIAASTQLCQDATRRRMRLPDDWLATNAFDTETYLQGELRYEGGFRGRLIFWTRPMSGMRILSLACHEGFPGHFLHAAVRERRALDENRPELFALPYRASVINEGVADFAYQAVFTREEQARALAETLFPIAGLDPADAEMHVRIWHVDDALKQLAAAEGGRRLLAGEMTRAEVEAWFQDVAVASPQSARGWFTFVEEVGVYALLYSAGEQRIRRQVEAAGGTLDAPERRWAAYSAIIAQTWPQP
jgi:hypothetical protein